MKNQLEAIVRFKNQRLNQFIEGSIDYRVLEEEIKDAQYALLNLYNIEALKVVYFNTTSGTIYDLLKKFLEEQQMNKKLYEIFVEVVGELDDAIGFMETFDIDDLGEENRLQNKYNVMEKADAFLKEYNNGTVPEANTLIIITNDLNNRISYTVEEFETEAKNALHFAINHKEYNASDLTADFIAEEISGVFKNHNVPIEGMNIIKKELECYQKNNGLVPNKGEI